MHRKRIEGKRSTPMRMLLVCRCSLTKRFIVWFMFAVSLMFDQQSLFGGSNVVTTVKAEFRHINNDKVSEQQQQQQQQQDRPISNIVGGMPVSTLPDKALYASFAIPTTQRLFCGSILIWDDVLLSAAHCEDGFRNSNDTTAASQEITVNIGGTTLNGTDAVGQNIPVRTTIIHPDYKIESIDNQVENDIMLIFLQRPTNPTIPLAKFNIDPKMPPDDAEVTVIGHGITGRRTNELTYQLNALNMTIVNFFTCDNAYDILNEEVHLCATGITNTTPFGAPCDGDSGGPLLYSSSTNSSETVIVGIVSFGICTYQPDVPSTVFTKISSYPDWILSTICNHSMHPPTTAMCNGIVPLSRIPVNPSSPPPESCTFLLFFTGVYVHRFSWLFGHCIQQCTLSIVRSVLLQIGWYGGKCD